MLPLQHRNELLVTTLVVRCSRVSLSESASPSYAEADVELQVAQPENEALPCHCEARLPSR